MLWTIKLENKYPFHPIHLDFIVSITQSFSSDLNWTISPKLKTTTKHVLKHNSAIFFPHSQIDWVTLGFKIHLFSLFSALSKPYNLRGHSSMIFLCTHLCNYNIPQCFYMFKRYFFVLNIQKCYIVYQANILIYY